LRKRREAADDAIEVPEGSATMTLAPAESPPRERRERARTPRGRGSLAIARSAASRVTAAALAQWRIVAAIAAAAALLAWLFAALQTERYRATAIAAIAPLVDLPTTDILRGVDTLERRTLVATVAALAATPLTRRTAVPPDGDGYTIEAVVMPNTNLLRISVEGKNPRTAAEIANRVPAILSAQTRAMYKLYRVATVSAAATPSAPLYPRTGRTIFAGLLVGIVLGAIAAWGIERRRPAAPV
jgi:hypothetical protein